MVLSSGKIPGHSGTDFKNRKGFQKQKAILNQSRYHYGVEYGSRLLKLDEGSKARIRKQNHQLWWNYGVGLFLAFGLILITVYWFAGPQNRTSEISPDRHYALMIDELVKESRISNRSNWELLRLGYEAWAIKDYDEAIYVFESIEDHELISFRKECALYQLYYDYCNKHGMYCSEFRQFQYYFEESINVKLLSGYQASVNDAVRQYNAEMMEYY